jgi:hypothetical protein
MTIADRWAALQFDQAVVAFGTVIENASGEQINVGGESQPRWVAKYTFEQLLTPGFVIGGTGGEGSDDAPLPRGVDGLIVDEVT